MKKVQSILIATFLLLATAAFAQPKTGVKYLITSNLSNLNIVPNSPTAGANLQQSDTDGVTAHWQFVAVKSTNLFFIANGKGLYLAAPVADFSVKKLVLSDKANDLAKWELIPAGERGFQIKNFKTKGFVGNSAKMESGAAILHFLSPGEGSFWKFVDKCEALHQKLSAAEKAADECETAAFAKWKTKNSGKQITQEEAAKIKMICFNDSEIPKIKREMQDAGCKE